MGGRGGGLATGLKMCSKACYISSAFLKLQNAIKRISFQYKLEGAYIGRRWGRGLITRSIFCLQEDGLLLGGGGAYTCNCRRGVIVILEVYSNLPETVKLLKSWHFEN